MAHQTFGQALGTLIYEKRKAQGLTQTQLAEDAFQSSGKVRRISELENGSVANPHPKTIDPLIFTLGIQESEIEECARIAGSKPDPDLDSAYREARNLIEAIARQFDHDNPEASLAELDDFLRGKAREWRALRDRIKTSEADSEDIKSLKTQAKDALADAKFDDADNYLAQAETIQQKNKALKEVRKLAQLRISRGDISYLAGMIEQAKNHYLSAAEFLMPFDETEGVDLLSEIARNFYEAGRRLIKYDFEIPIALLEKALQTSFVSNNSEQLSNTYYKLSLVYRYVMQWSEGEEKKNWSDITTDYARKAVQSLPSDGDISAAISTKLSLGNALYDRANILNEPQIAEEAVSIIKSTIAKLDDDNTPQELKGHLFNSLGSAEMALNKLKGTENEKDAHDEAIKAFTDAISSAESIADVEVWGIANSNLATLLSMKARQIDEKPVAYFYRLRAIGTFLSAIEAYPSTLLPRPYAQCHIGLANVLFEHGTSIGFEQGTNIKNNLSEIYLYRSLKSYELAAEIFDELTEPIIWAEIQTQMGRIHMLHAQLEGVDEEIQKYDYDSASSLIEDAIRVYEQHGLQEMVTYCEEALAKFKEHFSTFAKR